jgi:putative DNA primase/helicase
MLVVEGEKSADAANTLFPDWVAVTSQGGSKAVGKADWTSLRGRSVMIWPDHDDPGQDYASRVALALEGIATSVRVVAVPEDWPKGWDLADPHPAGLPDDVAAEHLRGLLETAADALADGRPPDFTDEALALRFTERHSEHLRYVHMWGRWLIRDSAVWRFDETLHVLNLARAVCRSASSECSNVKVAAIVASAKTVAAVERLAKADRRHASTVDQWDADPWLLNTPSGVVDLTTGQVRPHRSDDYMTKITAVGPGCDCPLWRKFLARITADDLALQAFLQRAAGYALTGITNEHALFFAYGTGGNGKSVFLSTLTGIMRAYAAVAQMETFTVSQGERHPADLAMLRGARLVTAQETEEGRRWAESRIKAMSGGDPITARFMRQDFFTYIPAFKLFIAGNHKPGLRRVDEAIRRRFHLIPFEVNISPQERDRELSEKLKAEWPGILAWAIEGCLRWQRIGLAPPASVQDATNSYLEAEDAIGMWISDCCMTSSTQCDLSGNLFVSWKDWAEKAGEQPGSQKRFSQALEARGFTPSRQAKTGRSSFGGIAVRPVDGAWYHREAE